MFSTGMDSPIDFTKKIIFYKNVAKVITNNFGFLLFSVHRKKHGEKCYFMKVVRKLPTSPRYRLTLLKRTNADY